MQSVNNCVELQSRHLCFPLRTFLICTNFVDIFRLETYNRLNSDKIKISKSTVFRLCHECKPYKIKVMIIGENHIVHSYNILINKTTRDKQFTYVYYMIYVNFNALNFIPSLLEYIKQRTNIYNVNTLLI